MQSLQTDASSLSKYSRRSRHRVRQLQSVYKVQLNVKCFKVGYQIKRVELNEDKL